MSGLPRVLIVDYDPKNVRTLRDLFVDSGYQVESVADGVAAISTFKKLHPSIILLEAMIPKKHGFEVCQEIKKSPEGRSTPIIIMTAVYKGRKYRSQAMHVHGCDEYVEKPITPEALLEIVKRFVPPGSVARAVAVGGEQKAPAQASAERLGEVIPFPAGRSAYTLPDIDVETEREIMSKLDEILPDTPLFDQSGLSASASSAATAASETADFEITADEDEDLADLEETPVATRSPEAPSRKPSSDSPKVRQTHGKKPPKAMKADDVMKLTRSKRGSKQQEPAPRRSFLSISPALLIGLVLAIIATVISYLLGRV